MTDDKDVFKYELHSHTSLVSRCGRIDGTGLVHSYYNAGYTGIVITDHFFNGNCAVEADLPWEERVAQYTAGYLQALDAGKALGMDVFFGVEFGSAVGKDFLTYGVGPEFYAANPDIMDISIDEYCARVHRVGGFVSIAHPFREAPYILPDMPFEPSSLDAAEVYNFSNEKEWNESALKWAIHNRLIMVSGADDHTGESAGMAGVAVRKRAAGIEDLIRMLRNGSFELIVNSYITRVMERDTDEY